MVASVLPRNSRNSQKFCCVCSPTDFTDLHRWLVALIRPRNSQNSQKFCCVSPPTEFTEFTEVWLRRFSHRIHGIHRSFVASHSSINLESVLWEGLLCQKVLCVLCVLWEVFLCQKVPCVLCVLWEYSLPRILQINTDGWLRKSSHGIHRIHRSLGGCWLRGYGRMPYPPNLCASVPICGRCFSARRFCAFRGFCGNIVSHGLHRSTQMVGCVNSPTEFTEFTEVWGYCWLRGYGRMPYPPNLCASVPICGRYFSARRFCAFRAFCGRCFSARRFRVFCAFCGRYFSTRRVRSVGDYSFSMRKRLTMPKTRA